ncbi:small-conductance mechanosensitive channel [Dysgonomonas sp. PFB1-18]|uniref:mechanosensitive ion channel family protein n=1 Tax=unclassified Dysgonomonas TaxID=2630389 RepID=UPI002476B43D|nr:MULTISPECIES: mechanosensitive ion channel family protein [unclassified Dysgonomonas]MDH6309257.1 small-conductance mechanosensitive channel [Dysgonomonas sp. PF1-14]MDH6338863.1 small-conductance mechanosensitive channel [Dysgonomonas sp. PF1-16]MDH6380506.1 small-conductance mechanosensitive channel [Dysgonomonas sp. PFB1-18]MDH6397691.1 small-conductance mechanosensitive channel [Dysgonomonas sp. PF1-23]
MGTKRYCPILYKTILIALLCLVSLGISAQRRSSKQKQPVVTKVDSTQIALNQSQGAPVAPFRDTLFLIHGSIGSFTVQQRAAAINEKIQQLEEYVLYSPDSLRLEEFNDQINIVYEDGRYQHPRIIVSIDTLQAQIYGRSKTDLAQSYLHLIISAIDKEQYDNSWKRKGIQALTIILIIVAEYFFIRLIQYLYRRLRIVVRKLQHKKIKGFLGIIDAEKEVQIIFALLRLIRFLIIATALGAGLLLIFKLFPYTTSLSDQLIDYIVAPLKKIGLSIKNYMPNLFTILIIIVIFRYIKKFLRSITDKITEGKITFKGFYPDWAKPTYNIVTGILLVFTFILIFPYLPESDSQVFQGVSVFVGLIISLGSTSVIGNLIAGLVITYMRPFRMGDRVKMDDTTGTIIEKTALVTRVRTAKNEIITIPNSSVMNTKTVNYTFSANQYGLILFSTVTIGYEVPWRQVHELLLKVAYKTENLNRKQKPFIMQTALNDFYVEYQLNVYTKDANKMNDIYSDLRKNIQDVFNEAGIEIRSSHYNVNTIYNMPEPYERPPYGAHKEDQHS